uniref:Uncharacterized protein n=1 Tax=Amphiprion percula TaxID=161767 RepID=A0A3P8SCR9_AMPPE
MEVAHHDVKHGGGTAGPGRLVKVEGKMNAAKSEEILEDNLMQSEDLFSIQTMR